MGGLGCWILVDRKLPFTAIKSIVQKILGKFGLMEVLPNEDGFFFYQFDKAGTYRQVIESGPWHFGGRLMVLKQWHPQLNLVNEQLAKIPLWAHFYNVPLELWTVEG